MDTEKAHNLACPIDGAQLNWLEKQMVCENGHAFDIARQGYVNLLPVQHKRSKYPGDSKEMVIARSHFLASKIYQPIADKLAELVSASIYQYTAACVFDAGCGEGYYSDHVFHYLKDKKQCENLSFIGLDISKPAIIEAAKRNKQITWVVGTNRNPPIEAASVDIITCIFGFQSFEGFNQIIKTAGKIILVEPGPDHLKELREIIYKDVIQTPLQNLSNAEELGFTIVANEPLQFETGTLEKKQINDLLLMTPHFFRATKEGRDAASTINELKVTVDVVFRTLEKQ